jgi:hypothetical protein
MEGKVRTLLFVYKWYDVEHFPLGRRYIRFSLAFSGCDSVLIVFSSL